MVSARGCSHPLADDLKIMGFLDRINIEEDIKNKSDEEILALSIKHPHVFGIIIDRYQTKLLRKAYSILHSKEEAEDIVQEVFTKIYLNAHKFEVQEGASFNSWAYRILFNTSFTRYQKVKRERNARKPIDPEIFELFEDKISRYFEKQEISEYIISILVRMPDHLGRVLRLHIIEGRSQEEVAEIEGVSVGAVKARVHRAKKAFKKIDIALI